MKNKHGYYLEELSVGMSSSYEKSFSKEEVELFSSLSGDTNPIHLDFDFAKESIFKSPIVHGALTTSLISKVLGTQLPGPGAIFISQSSKFLAPVRYDDVVIATVTISEINEKRRRVFFETSCVVNDQAVVEGIAEILVERLPR